MIIPRGNNRLSSLASFAQRKFYEEEAFDFDLPQTIDLWYDRPLYGKVDNRGNSVYPAQRNLKQLVSEPDDQKVIFALDFVVDAWNDFRFNSKLQTIRGNYTDDEERTTLINLEPKKGYQNSNNFYETYITEIFDIFANDFAPDKGRDSRIRNFYSFVPIFIEFISLIGHKMPFTRTGFTKTPFFSPYCTGLAIDFLDNQEADDDRSKVETILQDPNFPLFIKEAQRYSFYVDKNVPWRLIFDVNSVQTKKYFEPYGLTLQNLFDKRYNQTTAVDLIFLRNYLLEFYNSYIAANPFVRISKQALKCKTLTVTETFVRKTTTLDKVQEIYDDGWWLRLYAYLRAVESGRDLEQVQFDNISKRAEQIGKYKSIENSTAFINQTFRDQFSTDFARIGTDLSLQDLQTRFKPRSFRF